jgi:hypothetical protein
MSTPMSLPHGVAGASLASHDAAQAVVTQEEQNHSETNGR